MGGLWRVAALVLASGTFGGPAFAQAVQGPSLSVEAMSDLRERGLSWSRGAPTLAIAAHMPLVDRIGATAELVGLRGSARADGADVGLILGARYSGEGALRLSGGGAVRLFPGRASLTWWEVDARADYDIGPATLGVGVAYAPVQRAIGGDSLHLRGDAAVALPGLPLRIQGGIGHSRGRARNAEWAARLRPGGAYTDYRLGMEYLRDWYAVGVRYTDTSISDSGGTGLTDRHVGSRINAYLRVEI